MRFAKTGPARFIPHIDFMEIIKRALRIARAPVSFSQGFNKRERISAGFPLPVGIESVCELCDCDLYEEADPVALAAAMNSALPEGIMCAGARVLEERESLMTVTAAMEFRVQVSDGSLMEAVGRSIEKKADPVKETKGGMKRVEFNRVVLGHAMDGAFLNLVLSAGDDASMRIDHVLLFLAGTGYDDFFKFSVVKTRQYRREGDKLLDLQ
jgi:radical SAM-linked protein